MPVKPQVLAAVISVLEDTARRRGTLSYKQLSDEVDGLPVRGTLVNEVLAAVSEHSWEEHGVLLPVLVVNASGRRLPSSGFYASLRVHRPDLADGEPDVVARRERERVYRAYPCPAGQPR